MSQKQHHVCPVGLAGHLDNRIRRLYQNPRKLLAPYLRERMTVLDVGCGPGFFSIDMAEMVGPLGRVIAADLQEGMLRRLRNKIEGTPLEERVKTHKTDEHRIGVTEKVDFILAFYMVHEVPDKTALFKEMVSLLKPGGCVLIVEPPFHVSAAAFAETIKKAEQAGLKPADRPKMLFSKAVLMRKD